MHDTFCTALAKGCEGEKKEGGEEERQEETLLSFLSRLSFGSHTALLPPHLLEVVTGGNY